MPQRYSLRTTNATTPKNIIVQAHHSNKKTAVSFERHSRPAIKKPCSTNRVALSGRIANAPSYATHGAKSYYRGPGATDQTHIIRIKRGADRLPIEKYFLGAHLFSIARSGVAVDTIPRMPESSYQSELSRYSDCYASPKRSVGDSTNPIPRSCDRRELPHEDAPPRALRLPMLRPTIGGHLLALSRSKLKAI